MEEYDGENVTGMNEIDISEVNINRNEVNISEVNRLNSVGTNIAGKFGLEEFLANVSLVADIDNLDEENNNVILMTIHSAKGLEFPVVFIVGMEEGIFPGYRALYNETELEEERRLCYVGITRAKEKLYMSYTRSRTLFGKTTNNRLSRFVEEIPVKYLEGNINTEYDDDDDWYYNDFEKDEDSYNTTGYGNNTAGYSRIRNEYNFRGDYNSSSGLYNHRDYGSYGTSNFERPTVIEKPAVNNLKPVVNSFEKSEVNEKFEVGNIVIHSKFGKGVITKVEGKGADQKLEIVFNNHGMKRLMAATTEIRTTWLF